MYLTEYNFYGDGLLYALDAATGNVIWSQSVQRTDSTPALAYGNVYISGGVEELTDLVTYCFNASNGNLLWNTSASDEIGNWKCSVAVADGKVFSGKPYFSSLVMDFIGTYALDSATGDVIWSYPAGGSSPAIADGTVFTIGSGRVYAFRSADDSSGETGYVSGSRHSSGVYPPISQECATTDLDNDSEPIAIPTIPTPTHHESDTVLDDGDNAYHTSDDDIDSPGTPGFTLSVTVLLGIILIVIGLLVLIWFVRRGGGMGKV